MTVAAPVSEPPLRTVSLRRRVAMMVMVLLVVVLTSLGLIVNWLLTDALKADLKTRLQDRASYAGLLHEQGVGGQSLADDLAGGGVFSTFTSGDRHYVGRDNGPPAGPRPHPGPPPRPAVEPTVSYSESNGQLAATVTLSDGTLTLSTSESEIQHTLSELRKIELLAGAGTIVVAGLLLFRLIGVALRPLHQMTSLARRIRDGARGGRLRPTRPKTDLGRAAVAFDEMLDALEAAEEQAHQAELQMRQFLADASHDLRTPLAGVIAGSEQLLQIPSSRIDREARLVAVVRQARRAARLVDDLLLMTRLEDGITPGAGSPLDRRPIVLDFILAREVEALQLRRPDLLITGRRSPISARLNGDADQLHRALGNLLDNAARATPPGGQVRVDVSDPSDGVVMRISDTGPGVAPADRERIFDRFVRLADDRPGGGSGLGLPITRAIFRAHGGDVRCVDPATGGGGACFEIRLPLDVAAPIHPTPRLEIATVPALALPAVR